VLLPVGALVLAVLPEMWLNASSGLENGLVFAWLGACLLCLARWSRRQGTLGTAGTVLIGFGPLVRPELTLASLVFLVVVLANEWRLRRPWGRLRFVLVALALPIAYEVFRMGYYASLTPNSAIAKESTSSYWSSGWQYLLNTLDPYWLWLPLGIVAIAAYWPLIRTLRSTGQGRALTVVLGFVAVGLASGFYVVRVGGDFIHARLLLPALFALLAPVAVVPLRRVYVGVAALLPWALIVLFFVRSPRDAPHPFLAPRNAVTLSNYKYAIGGKGLPWFKGHGVYFLRTRLPAKPASGRDASVAVFGVGAVGYALGPNVYVLDLLGLGDALTAHLQLTRRGLVGHEKPLPAPWIDARLTPPGSALPSADFVYRAINIPSLGNVGSEPFDARVADARAALNCGTILELHHAVSDPLDPGQFVSNLTHAFSLWRLRIPPEPRDAVARFCPSGTPVP
jgi:arabinofuranosyltransferase